MAQLERAEPPYVQIADHYRRLITNGTLAEGDRLPSVRQIAEEWGVVRATANRSVRYLAAAGLIDTTQSGSVVRRRRATPTPRDRIRLTVDDVWLDGETVQVREAGIVQRQYVAQTLGLADDAQLIRREQITYRDSDPVMLAVHWLPGEFAEVAPELTSTEAMNTLPVVRRATGRTVKHGGDALMSRTADRREADALQLPVGTSVLAVVWRWSDDQGVIEYGEYVCPAEHAVTYEYEVAA